MPRKNLKRLMDESADLGLAALADANWKEAEAAWDAAIGYAKESKDKLSEALFRSYRGQARQREQYP